MCIRDSQYIGLLVAQRIFALDSAETTAMMKAVIGSETNTQRSVYMLDTFLRGMEYGHGWNGDITKAQALAWLDREGADTSVDGAELQQRKTAFKNGRTYLASR